MSRLNLSRIAARRIALVKPSALGDIVHALPVAHALRCRFPLAHIAWVVNRSYAPLLQHQPDIDSCIEFDRKRGIFGFARLWCRLRRERFDLVVDLQGLLRTGLMTLAGAPARRIGLSTAREGSRWCYTQVVPVPRGETLHAVDRYWLIAQALGVGDLPKRFRLTLDPQALAWARSVWSAWPRPWLVVAPGARWETKRWPARSFAELLRRLGTPAVIVGTAEERLLAETVANHSSVATLNLAGQTTLPQLAALLSLADVVLANDSGPLHLAAALGRCVVAPYTCTRIAQHGPYPWADRRESPCVWPIPTRVDCQGSYRRRCRALICHRDLTPDDLWPAVQEALSRCRSISPAA